MRAVESIAEARARYDRANAIVQQQVQGFIIFQPQVLQPLSLRQGISNAIAANAALARLLMEKGIFTEAEYFMALADEMENEVERWGQRLKGLAGKGAAAPQ
jgi:hypothetical protein